MRVISILLALTSFLNGSSGFQPSAVSITGLRRSKSVPDRHPYATSGSPKRATTQLDAINPLIASVASPIGAIAVLASVIIVHESGHYLAARSFGMKVEEFSIGVGPKILGFEALGNEFNLRAIPLGGYVRFPENYNQTLARVADDLNMLKDAREAPVWKRKLTNFVSLGTYEDELENLEKNLIEIEQVKQPWWKKLFGGSKATVTEATLQEEPYEIEYYDDPDLLQNRPWPERAVVIAGGVIFNFILAFLIYFGEISNGGLTKPVFDAGAIVSTVPASTAAASGVLSKGDVILAFNGSPMSSGERPSAAASQKAIGEFIATIRATPEGESMQLSVLKAGAEKAKDISIKPKSNGEVQSIGAMLGPNFSKMETIQSSSPVEAAKLASTAVGDLTAETFNGLSQFGASLFKSKAAAGGNLQLSGPIGLIRTGSEVVSTSSLATVAVFAAAISINLAVVNSLPLPALDGGQMVFIVYEAIAGKKVNQQVQENVTGLAVLALFLLSLSTTVGDIQNLFK